MLKAALSQAIEDYNFSIDRCASRFQIPKSDKDSLKAANADPQPSIEARDLPDLKLP
jgi:hypothetical protein